jgi:hypothetical protein
MNTQQLTDLLNTSPKKVKRVSISYFGTLTTDDLRAMCPLSRVENTDILSGCLAGIVYFCQGQTDLTQCHKYYNEVFSYSIYAPVIACAAWKSGPESDNCRNAVNDFNVSLAYTNVNKKFAIFFKETLFTNPFFAPCNSQVMTCNK